jgi:glycosyltransferase involved in cell wall biosynthesis
MIKDRNILAFGDDWGRNPSTIQHIVKVFARQNRIIWVGSLGLRKPSFRFQDVIRIVEKISVILKPSDRTDKLGNPVCIHPMVIPFHDFSLAYKINMSSVKRSVNAVFKKYDVNRPILIASYPWIADLLGEFGETSSHYICQDDYTQFEGAFNFIGAAERRVIDRVDCAFFISDSLMKQRAGRQPRAYLLPQGVDVGHFTTVRREGSESVPEFKKPVVGFFGLFSEWVDIALIHRCAKQYPHATFLLVGKSVVDLSELRQEPNVKYVGEVAYQRLPQYARQFDVGLIPFRINELTLAANPLKLLEYMANGTAVVSTRLPEVEKFKPLVSVAQNDNDFVSLVGNALNERTEDARNKRKLKAVDYSWERIAENVSSIVEECEREKRK